MWTYNSSNGNLSQNGELIGTGYSGSTQGKNNPLAERIHNLGPIPRGDWYIDGPPFDTPTHGPYVMRLIPKEGTDIFGRSGFLIHGDSIENPGKASQGCIILNRIIRMKIWESSDYDLEVV